MKDEKWRQLSKYENIFIRDFRNKIKENPDPKLLRDFYLRIKEIAPLFYDEEGMHSAYYILKDILIESELTYDGQYIVDTLPDFKNQNELFMDKLVHHMRLFLLKRCWVRKCDYEQALREKDFINYCVESSDKIKMICNQLGIECKSLVIHPGFDKEAQLYHGCGHHAFNIITFCGEHYLVDCTYRQFFEVGDNIIERIGVVGLAGCKPGVFMLMDEDRKHLAEELIKKGYVKLNEKVLKDYLDGFTMSFRNGLYYEETGDYSFTVPYTFDEYIDFLNGKDSQVNREGKLVLGYHEKPVTRINME